MASNMNAPGLNAQQARSRLLSLPGEIHNRIYRYALIRETFIIVHLKGTTITRDGRVMKVKFELTPGKISPRDRHRLKRTLNNRRSCLGHPPLVQACRMIYQEARSIFWSENAICFTEKAVFPDTIQGFRRLAGPRTTFDSTSLKISRDCSSNGNIVRVSFTVSATAGQIGIELGTQRLLSDTWDPIPRHLEAEALKVLHLWFA